MSTAKFEKLIDLIINEDQERAEQLFHEIVVEKSREIYESMMEDDHSQPRWGDSRKTKGLTLAAINKIRRMKEVRTYEQAENLKKIRKQYSPPAPEGGL